ncbi:MAG: AAA family ATPase, partial [Planctomycetota bacterium]
DFKNVILIMTSNIGADLIKGGQQFGFGKREDEAMDYEKIKKTLMAECEKHFRPEFLNRLDEIIVFRSLIKDDLYDIIEIELSKVRERLQTKGMMLELDQKAKDFLIEKGFNPDFGARPLRRAISTHVEDPLAESLLSGEFKSGLKIVVTHKEDAENLFFESEPLPKDESDEGGDDDGGGPKKPTPDKPTEAPAPLPKNWAQEA